MTTKKKGGTWTCKMTKAKKLRSSYITHLPIGKLIKGRDSLDTIYACRISRLGSPASAYKLLPQPAPFKHIGSSYHWGRTPMLRKAVVTAYCPQPVGMFDWKPSAMLVVIDIFFKAADLLEMVP